MACAKRLNGKTGRWSTSPAAARWMDSRDPREKVGTKYKSQIGDLFLNVSSALWYISVHNGDVEHVRCGDVRARAPLSVQILRCISYA